MKAARELIVHKEDAQISVLNRLFPTFRFYFHHHPELEFNLIVSGRGLLYVGDSVEEFGPGHTVLFGENTPHTYSSKVPCRSICVQFHSDLFASVLGKNAEADALFEKARHGLHVTGALGRTLASALKAMDELPPHSLRRIQLLFDLLVKMTEAPSKETRKLSVQKWDKVQAHSDEPDVRALLSYLHSETPGKLQQKEVAKSLHLSPTAFSHWFTKKFGRNYLSYINEVKVARACRELMEGGRQLIEVSHRAGFESLPTFIRQFKSLKKMTPGEYRRKFRRGP